MRRYVAAPEHSLAAAVVWAARAHLLYHEQIYLAVSPKLAIQPPDRGCGKTTLLEVLGTLIPRPETGSSITAAAVFRLIEARKPTLLLDEADRIIRGTNAELIAVLDSSHRRIGAYVWRVVDIGGELLPQKFSTWAAIAFAGIKELPTTLQDRCIVIRLSKARPGEVPEHLRNGSSPPLRALKRKLVRWARDLTRLPEPALPASLYNRAGDNWLPIFAVAEGAGGIWPQLVRQAALAALAADQAESVLVHLLDGIRRALGERNRIRTRELLDCLLADDEHDWTVANRGKPINDAWLRERLRNVITPATDGKPGSERWGTGNNKERGYSRSRFVDAWQRYLSSSSPQNHPDQPDHPAQSSKTKGNSGSDGTSHTRTTEENPAPGNGAGPDAEEQAACDRRTRSGKKPTESAPGPDGPGGPGDFGLNEKGMPPGNGQLGEEEIL
jgi:putative DNA primase/helicase